MLGAVCGDVLGSSYEFEEKKYAMINQEILLQEGQQICEEGCLSFTDLFYSLWPMRQAGFLLPPCAGGECTVWESNG